MEVFHEYYLKAEMLYDSGYRPILVGFGVRFSQYFKNFEKKILILVDGESSLSNDGMVILRTTEEALYSVEFFNELVKAINVILCR